MLCSALLCSALLRSTSGVPSIFSADIAKTWMRSSLFFTSLSLGLNLQDRAETEIASARSRGMSMDELRTRLCTGQRCRTIPNLDAETESGGATALGSGLSRASNLPPQLQSTTGDSQDIMERRGDGASSLGGGGLQRHGSDEIQGLVVVRGHEGNFRPIEQCRNRSRSAWLHFPHVELLFLFFAFEGAVASQVSAIRHGGCRLIIIVASVALVSGAS